MNKYELLAARVTRLENALAALPVDESGRSNPAKSVPLQMFLEQAKRELYNAKEGKEACIIIS